MSFDRVAETIKKPEKMKAALLEEQLKVQLKKVLGELNQDMARDPDVVLYLLVYLEHAVVGEKKGLLRKQIACNVLSPYFTTDNERLNLSKMIDFLVEHELVKKIGCVKMVTKTILKYLQFKMR